MVRALSEARRTSYQEYADQSSWSGFRAGVSLHAHTHYSREVMANLPRYIARIPLVAARFERELQDYAEREGEAVDFAKGWWHPPVSPQALFDSEVDQIEARFDLGSMVSVTDHDDIRAGVELQTLYAARRAPISFEWTIPYGEGYFHFGVHNLPPERASGWFARLAQFTAGVRAEALEDILFDLNHEDLLLVFNHPMWDLANVGQEAHADQLRRFLASYRRHIHALEVNGYRSHRENARARALSLESGIPLISGGDRHGCAPNALLNVTRAETFAEFVAEVRDGVSHLVVMPEYRRHIATRILASASDVLRHYPSLPSGRRLWTDRVSCDTDGSIRPLSYHWPDGGPFWVRSSIRAFQFLTSPVVLPVIRAALETFDGPLGGPTYPTPPAQRPVTGAFEASQSN